MTYLVVSARNLTSLQNTTYTCSDATHTLTSEASASNV